MYDTDRLLGIQKPAPESLREVKVKLPVPVVLRLHYLKLSQSQTFSQSVTKALEHYFETHGPSLPDDGLN